MKALRVDIYKHKGETFANGGISERFDTVLVICNEGNVEVEGTEENLCKIVTRNLFGREYKHVEPVNGKYGAGFMAGGSFVASCDSRFHRIAGDYPLALHDRCETWEENEMLSH